MEIFYGVLIGIAVVLAIPAFFILKWFLGDLFGAKGGRGFH
jgi:hypothetical protein